jgi:hypothetical protein
VSIILRSARSVTRVSFKALYIRSESDVVFSCFVAFFCHLAFGMVGVGRYELTQIVHIGRNVFQ